MPIPLFFLLASPPQGGTIIDQAIAAHRARKAYSVGITVGSVIGNQSLAESWSLGFQPPTKVLLQKKIAGKVVTAFWMNGDKFVAYDPIGKEIVFRKAPIAGPVVNRMANALGGIDDAISVQLSADTLAGFLKPFKQVTGWAVAQNASVTSLSREAKLAKGRSFTRLDFSTRSHLLTGITLVGPGSRLLWSYAYGPAPSRLEFRPAPGTKTVRGFTGHATVGKSDPKGKALVESTAHAYNGLLSAVFTVSGSTGTSTVWISGKSYREKQAVWEWSYTKGALTLRNQQNGRTYRGKCKPGDVPGYLLKIRAPMEPMLQSLIKGKNPLSTWVLPIMSIKSTGSVQGGEIAADAVELRTKYLDISLLIRRDNHLLENVGSRTKDDAGKVLSESHREFKYQSVNQPVSAEAFAISGPNTLPLSMLGK